MANTFKFGGGNWAVKDGYALAYNDENGNFKPLPFDFTRASSATRVNRQGLIETVPSGKPRIDFTDNTSGHLLLEPSRTNLITYSEDFSDSSWIKVNATVSSNNSISPDGTLNGDLIQATSTNGLVVITNFLTETQQTISVFAKSGNYDKFKMGQASNEYYAEFDLTNGSVLSVNSNLSEASINYYGNGWYRCSVRYASPSGLKTLGIVIEGSGNNVNFFGSQSEFGSYPTSYIPTEGSSVTRVAPICKQDLSQVVSSNTHTIYWEGIAKSNSGNDGFAITFSESDTNINNAILLYRFSNGKIGFYGSLNQSPIFSAPLSESTASDMNTVAKYALAIENNRLSIYRNGTKIISSTATQTIPTNLKWLQLNRWNNISALNTSTYKDLRYYDTALTDTELQNLTS